MFSSWVPESFSSEAKRDWRFWFGGFGVAGLRLEDRRAGIEPVSLGRGGPHSLPQNPTATSRYLIAVGRTERHYRPRQKLIGRSFLVAEVLSRSF